MEAFDVELEQHIEFFLRAAEVLCRQGIHGQPRDVDVQHPIQNLLKFFFTNAVTDSSSYIALPSKATVPVHDDSEVLNAYWVLSDLAHEL